MNKQFGRGLLTAFIYYAIAGVVALLAYAVWGDQYAHAPSVYHLVILFTWLGGLIGAFRCLVKILRGVQTAFYSGVLLLHILVTLGPLIWIELESRITEKEVSAPFSQVNFTTEINSDTIY